MKSSLFQVNVGTKYIITIFGFSRLTCLPLAPHQIQHGRLELLQGHTNQSFEQQQILSGSAQTTNQQKRKVTCQSSLRKKKKRLKALLLRNRSVKFKLLINLVRQVLLQNLFFYSLYMRNTKSNTVIFSTMFKRF